MKKQILFLCAMVIALSGLCTPILGVTSARYKQVWRQQLEKKRPAVKPNQTKDESSESEELKNDRQKTNAINKEMPLVEEELAQDDTNQEIKKKSWFKKYFLKVAAVLAGAAIVGGYEWFAESYPDTVPAIGIKSKINSVLSWFGLGKQDENNSQQQSENHGKQNDTQPNQNNVSSNQSTSTTTTTSTTSTTSTKPVINQTTSTTKTTTTSVTNPTTSTTTTTSTTRTTPVTNNQTTSTTSITSIASTTGTMPSTTKTITMPTTDTLITSMTSGTSKTTGKDMIDQYLDDLGCESLSSSEDDDSDEDLDAITKGKTIVQPDNDNTQMISGALDKLLKYTQNTGNWFLELFDKDKNVSYDKHVDMFGATIAQMEKDINSDTLSNNNQIVQGIKDLGSFLLGQLKATQTTLNDHKTTAGTWAWKWTPALAKAGVLGLALKTHLSDTVKTERNAKLQKLQNQLAAYPDLNAKIAELQKIMSECGDKIEQQDENTLLAGLTRRYELK